MKGNTISPPKQMGKLCFYYNTYMRGSIKGQLAILEKKNQCLKIVKLTCLSRI